MADGKIRTAILGASGYTGAELIRLVGTHPEMDIVALTADRKAGQPAADVFPHLGPLDLPDLVTVDAVDWNSVDAVFCGLPHGTTQEIVQGLPQHIRVVDLSADFRFADPEAYQAVYGRPHGAPEVQKRAVYGLTEWTRDAVKDAAVVANPGCYPTCSLLPLLPVLAQGAIDPDSIIIDAKSGVSGAGRGLKEHLLFCEVDEGLAPYGVTGHRHGPEIDQLLGREAGRPVTTHFTPHLAPMKRGMVGTIYADLAAGTTAGHVHDILTERYGPEPFIHVLPLNTPPAAQNVAGSNYASLGVAADQTGRRVILMSAIDNLTKGASGAAVQNMNVLMGLPETTGLRGAPVFP